MTEHKSFEPTSLVLLIEHRICNCGREYTTPNTKLLVHSESGYTTAKKLSAQILSDKAFAGLPREERHLYGKAECCSHCFDADEGQLNLWPAPPKPTRMIPRQFRNGADQSLSGTAKPKPQPSYPSLEDF